MEISFAIVGARIVDGTGADPIMPGVVLVGADGRIAAVGHTGEVPIPDGTPTLDAQGLALIPGLIDGHQHLSWDKTFMEVHGVGEHLGEAASRDGQLVRAGYYAQLALASGITTLRDCGADDFSILELRDMINQGSFVGPRILACGRLITTTGGHAYTDWGADTADEVKKAVRALASRGVDFIKIMASGGTTSPGTNITQAQYTLPELQVAVNEAHRLGLQIATHAISTDSIRLAAEAGVDTIEHCSWIGSEPNAVTTDKTAVEFMLRKNVRVDHAIIPRPYLFAECGVTPSAEDQWWFNMLKIRWPFLHYMQEQGVTVFLGTDSLYGPWPGTDFWPGFEDFARAVEVIVCWGKFTPLQTISMVTHEAAKALRLDRDLGSIQEGKRADLVLLDGNPLEDIRALRQVRSVFLDGKLVADRGRIVLAGTRGASATLRGWELPV